VIETKLIGGKKVMMARFEATDPEGHRREVEACMAWLMGQPDGEARAIFQGMDKIDIKEHMDYYRQKAAQAKPKCGAFAFVGLGGLKSVLFNFIIISAGMPMRMVATVEEAEAWILERP
jgi:hypothetical protein